MKFADTQATLTLNNMLIYFNDIDMSLLVGSRTYGKPKSQPVLILHALHPGA